MLRRVNFAFVELYRFYPGKFPDVEIFVNSFFYASGNSSDDERYILAGSPIGSREENVG